MHTGAVLLALLGRLFPAISLPYLVAQLLMLLELAVHALEHLLNTTQHAPACESQSTIAYSAIVDGFFAKDEITPRDLPMIPKRLQVRNKKKLGPTTGKALLQSCV